MNADWRTRYDLAIDAAQQAGRLAMAHYEIGIESETKADDSPVTVADRAGERRIRDLVSKHFPADGFLGEEYGDQPGTSGYRWVIDPIDGTKNFIRGVPTWGVLVGLEYQDDPIAGAIVIPPLGQTYHALRGNGAYRDAKRIRVSDEASVSKAMLCYSSLNWFIDTGTLEPFLALYRRVARQRGFGDFYGFMLVAQGAAELMVDHGVHAWDVAAAIPIVEEAGGRFTDWTGVRTIHRPDVVATNGRLHADALAALAPALSAARG